MNKKINFSDLGNRLAYVALEVLRDNDGRMSLGDLLNEVYVRKSAAIPEEARVSYDSGGIRWKVNTQFQSDNFVKAGFLRKESGVWHLTAEGEKALKRGESAVIAEAKAAYRKWAKQREQMKANLLPEAEDRGAPDHSPADKGLEEFQSAAMEKIQNYIRKMHPYKFQDLCAALLRGMRYYVRDVSPPGADGGIDVLAYADLLGGRPPRLKVQVKHRVDSKTGTKDLRELAGILTEGDVGVFISLAGFAAGCRDFARNSGKHLELIDLTRFIDLWQKCYDNLSEEDKARLPLQAVYFLDQKRAVQE